MAKTVAEQLKDLASIHEQRSGLYGQDFLRVGPSLMAIFPEGLTLSTAEEFTRFALFAQIHGKLLRYAARFKEGGHADSLDDLAVYAQILRQVDESCQSTTK
jgi:hypothetical protein